MTKSILERKNTVSSTTQNGELELSLQRQLRGRVRDLRIIQKGRGVVLQGHSTTYYGKQLAQQALLEATSLPLVSNDIRVI